MVGEYDLNLSNGSVFTILYPLETNGPDNVSTPRLIQEARPQFPITFAVSGTNTFSIAGDFTSIFRDGFIFEVAGSTSNDRTYTVDVDAIFAAGETQITTVEPVTDNVADGSLIAHVFRLVGDMTYRFTSGFTFNVQGTFTPDISGIDTGTKTFTIGGDYTLYYTAGIVFTVSGSTGNDSNYTVVSSSSGGTDTDIIVVEVIPSAVVDGSLSGISDKSYTVDALGSTFDGTDTYIPVGNGNIRDNVITPIGIPYGEIIYTIQDTVSSLQLPGKGTLNYGEKLIENMVRMTEHFAADDAPEANTILGTSPAATPLVGQQWYNTTAGSEGFNTWTGAEWTANNDIDGGSLIFKDIESASTTDDIYITASETNLPVSYVGTDEPGLVIWQEVAPSAGEATFRVIDAAGTEALRVEYSGYTKTSNNLEVLGTGETYFHGQVGIGENGLPTIERTLTVQGDGISVNSAAATDARVVLDSPTGQVSSVDFEINNISQGSISVDGSDLVIASATDINLVATGSVGINQATPSADLDVVGTTELNGKTNVVSADFIVGIDGTGTEILSVDDSNSWVGISTAIVDATDVTDAMEITGNLRVNSQIFASNQTALLPTYTFTSDPNTGMFSGGTNVLAFSTGGLVRFSVNAAGAVQVPTGYEALVLTDNDIPNKKFVDDLVGSTTWREPVRVMDTTVYANQAAFPTGGTIDGVALATDDRVLFSNTVVLADRDVFIWNGATWDADTANSQSIGDAVYIQEGTLTGKVYALDVYSIWKQIGGGTNGINVQYQVITAGAAQLVFNLTSVNYAVATNRLQVYVDGVKQIITLAYTETSPTIVTFVGPSPFVGGEIVEFIAFEELTTNAIAKRETQTGLTGTPVINFVSLTYQLGSDNLLVFLNGQKMIKGTDYTETSDTSITWISPTLIAADVLEFYTSVPIVAGTDLRDIENVENAVPVNGDTLVYNTSSGLWEPNSISATAGIGYEYLTGITGLLLNITNVNTTATTGAVSYQQVFLNGLLQREDLITFPTSGNYYVSGANQITFDVALVVTDEVTVYQL